MPVFDGFVKGVKPDDLASGAKPKGEAKGDELLKPKPRTPRPALPSSSLPLELISHERIALVGNSLAERMNLYGWFETLLHTADFRDEELVVRNFGRPADEVGLRQRANDYTALDDPLLAFGPDTFFCFFGYNESFAGPAGVEKFKADYEKFLQDYGRTYPRDDKGTPPRFVLDLADRRWNRPATRLLPDDKAVNENLKLYAEAVGEVAKEHGLAFVDLSPPRRRFQPAGLHISVTPSMAFTSMRTAIVCAQTCWINRCSAAAIRWPRPTRRHSSGCAPL